MTEEHRIGEQLSAELPRLPKQSTGASATGPLTQDLVRAVHRSPAVTIVWRACDGWPVAFVSEGVRRYGHIPQDLVGLVHHERYVAAEDLPSFLTTFAEAGSVPSSRSLTREYRLLTRSGEKRWVRERLWVERDAGGAVTHLAGILVDIDDVRRLEASLAEKEGRLAVLFEHTTQPILLHDLGGRCIDANEAACDYLGYARDELTRVPLDTLFSPQAATRAQRLANGGLGGEAVLADALVARDGSVLPAVIECHVIALNGGHAILTRVRGDTPCAPTPSLPAVDADAVQTLRERIEELEATNSALTRERDDLTAALEGHLSRLREYEVLLRDVHHRVKNNLQVIASLLGLQAEYVDDPRALEAFAESQSRVRAMALVHERVYQSSDLARVDLAAYVRDLAERLFVAMGASPDIALRVAVEPATLPMDTAIPCGLLISELVSNSIKHAFPDGRSGTITVTLRRDGDRVALTVTDDGVGLPAGLDYRQSESLGLQLVTILAEQLGATLEIDGSQGTRVTVTFELGA